MIQPDDNRQCSYCDITEGQYRILRTEKDQPLTLTKDHVDAWKDTAGRGERVTWACARCNLTKNHTFTFDEMREIGQKFIKPMWQRIAKKKLEDLKAVQEYLDKTIDTTKELPF